MHYTTTLQLPNHIYNLKEAQALSKKKGEGGTNTPQRRADPLDNNNNKKYLFTNGQTLFRKEQPVQTNSLQRKEISSQKDTPFSENDKPSSKRKENKRGGGEGSKPSLQKDKPSST